MVVKGFRAAGGPISLRKQGTHDRPHCHCRSCLRSRCPQVGDPSYNTATSSEAWLSRLAVCLWIGFCWCCTLQGDCRCALRQTMSGGYAGLVVGPCPASNSGRNFLLLAGPIVRSESIGMHSSRPSGRPFDCSYCGLRQPLVGHCLVVASQVGPCRRGSAHSFGLARHGVPDEVWAAELHEGICNLDAAYAPAAGLKRPARGAQAQSLTRRRLASRPPGLCPP